MTLQYDTPQLLWHKFPCDIVRTTQPRLLMGVSMSGPGGLGEETSMLQRGLLALLLQSRRC